MVDALPETQNRPFDKSLPTGEGLTFMMSSRDRSRKSTPLDSNNETDPATLRFWSNVNSSASGWSDRHVLRHLTLPVANTLFLNGSRSTLFEDVWRITFRSSGSVIDHLDRRSLKSYDVLLHCHPESFIRGGYAPLRALTTPRKVIRSMGNVLAEIEIDGQAAPASRELEKAVTDYLGANPARGPEPLLVYALIQPGATSSTATSDLNKDGSRRSSVLTRMWKDAILFKVTGGGGGWGKKQGLLSLETAVDFETHDNGLTFPDLDDVEDNDYLHQMKSQSIVPQDSTVQFLVYSTEQPTDPGSLLVQPHVSVDWQTIILGTAPNPDTQDQQSDGQSDEKSSVKFLQDRFGMISYGGAAIGTDETPAVNKADVPSLRGIRFMSSRTRLDVPNSRFVIKRKTGGKRIGERGQSEVPDVAKRTVEPSSGDSSAD